MEGRKTRKDRSWIEGQMKDGWVDGWREGRTDDG